MISAILIALVLLIDGAVVWDIYTTDPPNAADCLRTDPNDTALTRGIGQ